MALGELAGWVALGVSIVLLVLFTLQAVQVSRLQRKFSGRAAQAALGTDPLALSLVVDRQAEEIQALRSDLNSVKELISSLETALGYTIQRVGLVRFNPFGDVGGDQSFAVALLDAQGNGVVVSSLHGRNATRFYAKPVQDGASPISLSEEEVQAVKQAMEGAPRSGALFAAR